MKLAQYVLLIALFAGLKAHACAAQDAKKRTDEARQATMEKAAFLTGTQTAPAAKKPTTTSPSNATRESGNG